MTDHDLTEYDRWLAWHHNSRVLRTRGAPLPPDGDPWGDQELIEASLGLVAPRAKELVDDFYRRLFRAHPQLRRLFPQNMSGQSDRLLAALLALAQATPAEIGGTLRQLGRDHLKFGIWPAHYAVVGDCLLATLAAYAGPAWHGDIEKAWLQRYQAAAAIMLAAAEAGDEPPYWYATVVDVRADGPAGVVLSLRPRQPFPGRPGQELTVESERLARVWRRFPIVAAGERGIQVAVRSESDEDLAPILVNVTRPGDTLRLGPPLESVR